MKKTFIVLFLLFNFFFIFVLKVSAKDACYVEESSIKTTETTVNYEVKCDKGSYINIVEIKDSGQFYNNRVNYKRTDKKSSFKETYKVDANRVEATIYIRVRYFKDNSKSETKGEPLKVQLGYTTIPEAKAFLVSENEAAICITNTKNSVYQNYVLNDKTANYWTFGKVEVGSETYSSCFTKLNPNTKYNLKFCRGNNNSDDEWQCTEATTITTPKPDKTTQGSVIEDSNEETTSPENAGGKNVTAGLAQGYDTEQGYSPNGENVSCQDISDIINEYWRYVMILAPIALIVLIAIDFIKVLTSGDSDALKKSSTNAFKRTISVIVLLMLPFILNMILGWFGLELCI